MDTVLANIRRNRYSPRLRDRDNETESADLNHSHKIPREGKRQLKTKDSPDNFPPRGAVFYKVRVMNLYAKTVFIFDVKMYRRRK